MWSEQDEQALNELRAKKERAIQSAEEPIRTWVGSVYFPCMTAGELASSMMNSTHDLLRALRHYNKYSGKVRCNR